MSQGTLGKTFVCKAAGTTRLYKKKILIMSAFVGWPPNTMSFRVCPLWQAGSMLHMTPSMGATEVDFALQAVLGFVSRALREMPVEDARWAPLLRKVATSQSLATAHRCLRALVFGAARSAGPLPSLPGCNV